MKENQERNCLRLKLIRSCKLLSYHREKDRHLKRFFARTSRSSHFKSILSPRDASVVLRGRFPFRDSFPFLLTLLSSELMHNLFESTRTMPQKFVSGFRRTGEDTVALWNDADPSSTGCSTVPLTYIVQQNCMVKKNINLSLGITLYLIFQKRFH